MLSESFRQIKTAFMMLVIFTILTGVIYPFVITGIAQLLFPWQANGSLMSTNRVIGSELIGQSFTAPQYFWSRPSATSPYPYNAQLSSGSNLGPSNPALFAAVKERVTNLRKADPLNNHPIPADLVTASGSGLDPDISPLSAYYQAARIAKARHVSVLTVWTIIQSQIQQRTFNILGEPRVNVLKLNLALDNIRSGNDRKAP